jgi:hypothetical protein
MVFGADALALLIRSRRAHPLAVLIALLGGHELRAVDLAAGARLGEHRLRREERGEHGNGNQSRFHLGVLSRTLRALS